MGEITSRHTIMHALLRQGTHALSPISVHGYASQHACIVAEEPR